MVRIGILLTDPKREQQKEELLTHKKDDPSCPWSKAVPEQFVFERKGSKGKYGIPTDVAIGSYIKSMPEFKDVELDFIRPEEVNPKRLASNDLNFLLIYDLLEAFHLDKSEDKAQYHAMKEALDSADNVYPPPSYQQLIYSKINYYNYLKENNVPILPTLTMTKGEYQQMGNAKAVQTILERAKSEEWGRFILKPVYGQEGLGCKFFMPSHEKSLSNHLAALMDKYPGVVVQKAVTDFGNTEACPELRMYHSGGKYAYSVSANHHRTKTPKEEGGTLTLPVDKLRRIAKTIIQRLPGIVMPNGCELPRLIDRIDMGVYVDGAYQPWVNEVEFVPSLYCENVRMDLMGKYIRDTGKQMVRITKQYAKSSGNKTGCKAKVSCSKSGNQARTSCSKSEALRKTLPGCWLKRSRAHPTQKSIGMAAKKRLHKA